MNNVLHNQNKSKYRSYVVIIPLNYIPVFVFTCTQVNMLKRAFHLFIPLGEKKKPQNPRQLMFLYC